MDEAPETPTPLLVYNRIDANRRKTRLILASFSLALVPVILCGAAFMVPWKAIYEAGMQSYVAAVHAQQVAQDVRQADWVLERWQRVLDRPATVFPPFDVGTLVLWMAIVVIALAGTIAFLISHYGSRVMLRQADARSVDPDEERDLLQIAGKLCIGAGLPIPRVHVIESMAPNAFATGKDPHDACLVVTRGLLGLLEPRELEGVVAHELSHIGNHDTELSTTVAAMVGALSLPWKVVSALFCSRQVAFAVTVFFLLTLPLLSPFRCTGCPLEERGAFSSPAFWQGIPTYVMWWGAYALIVPVYVVFVAPVVALFIRQAVLRQREFLADADAALLTRDPEGLALALVKIGAVGGERLRAGEGTVHLYFVDPLSEESWFHVVFPSHPALEERVELLGRMGNGIAPSAIQAAKDAGARFQVTWSEQDAVHAPVPGASREEAVFPTERAAPTDIERTSTEPGDTVPTGFDGFTRVYEQPVDGSRLLALVPQDAVLEPKGRVGDFVAVTTGDGMAGYVFRPEPLSTQTDRGH